MAPRKRQVYLVVMVLGAVALFVDRCLLPASVSEPQPVSALPPRTPRRPAQAAATPMAKEGLAELSVPELPFPRNLPVWDAAVPLRDIFSPDGAEPDKPRRSGRDDNQEQGNCAAFVKQHHLDAVFVQSSLRIAVIDGRWVRVGEDVAGCTLLDADGNKVRFRCRDGEVALTVIPFVENGDH
jgi:hypothetical protein